jgi:hypothetical protein
MDLPLLWPGLARTVRDLEAFQIDLDQNGPDRSVDSVRETIDL